jgi:2-keto-4-pentenoate hydratase
MPQQSTWRRAAGLAALTGLMTMAGSLAQAACLSDAEVTRLMASLQVRRQVDTPEGLSAADAACTRAKFNASLEAAHGRPVGYKAGLTNPAVQKRFQATAPVWGALYAPMLLKDGAIVDPAFGARPLFEADLLVRVSNVRINQARNVEDVLQSIDQVIPFIELPDLMVDTPAKINGNVLAAVNVGARYGVVGTPIPVQRTAEFSQALRDMQVVVSGNGAELDRGRGSDVLEHPLNAVVWLAQALQADGVKLKVGDVLSLGSFSKLMPPKPGLAVQVRYNGLPGNPAVQVQFR